MISRYPGQLAVPASFRVGDCSQRRTSSYQGFLLPSRPRLCYSLLRNRSYTQFHHSSLQVRSCTRLPFSNSLSTLTPSLRWYGTQFARDLFLLMIRFRIHRCEGSRNLDRQSILSCHCDATIGIPTAIDERRDLL